MNISIKKLLLFLFASLNFSCSNKLLMYKSDGKEMLDIKRMENLLSRVKKDTINYFKTGSMNILFKEDDHFGGSYSIEIKDKKSTEHLSVTKKDYKILHVYRTVSYTDKPNIVFTYSYFINGAPESSIAKQAIQIDGFRGINFIIGKQLTWSNDGKLIEALNYDNEFLYTINDVIKYFKVNVSENVIELTRSFKKKNENDPIKYPFWNISTAIDNSVTYWVLDGKTGAVVEKNSFKFSAYGH